MDAGGDVTDAAPVADVVDDLVAADVTDVAPVDVSTVSAQPPPPPASHPADGSGTTSLVITRWYFGDVDRDGTVDRTDGWRQFGYDIDHRISTASSTDLCQPNAGAPYMQVYPDGDMGIDNAFGHFVLPILLGISSTLTRDANTALAMGSPRPMFSLANLGASADQTGVATAIYLTSRLATTPRYDGTDMFDVDPASLVPSGGVTMPRAHFDTSYVTGNTFVTQPVGDLALRLEFQPRPLFLTIHHAVVSMQLAASRHDATNGTIAGILAPSELIEQVRQLVGLVDPSLCTGTTIDAVISQVQQAADILVDGTQSPAQMCNGISIGLGFDARLVQLGTVGAAAPTIDGGCL
jgi:hypothetical protein